MLVYFGPKAAQMLQMASLSSYRITLGRLDAQRSVLVLFLIISGPRSHRCTKWEIFEAFRAKGRPDAQNDQFRYNF